MHTCTFRVISILSGIGAGNKYRDMINVIYMQVCGRPFCDGRAKRWVGVEWLCDFEEYDMMCIYAVF